MLTWFLLLCIVGVGFVAWRAHRKHESALELVRGDIAILRAKYHDLKAQVDPPK